MGGLQGTFNYNPTTGFSPSPYIKGLAGFEVNVISIVGAKVEGNSKQGVLKPYVTSEGKRMFTQGFGGVIGGVGFSYEREWTFTHSNHSGSLNLGRFSVEYSTQGGWGFNLMDVYAKFKVFGAVEGGMKIKLNSK